jgi:hypothetical protein
MADDGGNGPPPDLRFSKHERNNVSVNRNLSEDGHLARGDKTRMSKVSFTARARPRDEAERDPVFVERDAASAVPPAPSTAVPVALPAPAVTPVADRAPTFMQRVARLFGGQGS